MHWAYRNIYKNKNVQYTHSFNSTVFHIVQTILISSPRISLTVYNRAQIPRTSPPPVPPPPSSISTTPVLQWLQIGLFPMGWWCWRRWRCCFYNITEGIATVTTITTIRLLTMMVMMTTMMMMMMTMITAMTRLVGFYRWWYLCLWCCVWKSHLAWMHCFVIVRVSQKCRIWQISFRELECRVANSVSYLFFALINPLTSHINYNLTSINPLTSHREMRWNVMKWDEMRWDVIWNLMKWDEMRWNEMKWDEVGWNEMKWDEMHWNVMKWDEVRWNVMKCDDMRWNEMKCDEMRGNAMKCDEMR